MQNTIDFNINRNKGLIVKVTATDHKDRVRITPFRAGLGGRLCRAGGKWCDAHLFYNGVRVVLNYTMHSTGTGTTAFHQMMNTTVHEAIELVQQGPNVFVFTPPTPIVQPDVIPPSPPSPPSQPTSIVQPSVIPPSPPSPPSPPTPIVQPSVIPPSVIPPSPQPTEEQLLDAEYLSWYDNIVPYMSVHQPLRFHVMKECREKWIRRGRKLSELPSWRLHRVAMKAKTLMCQR